MKLLKWILIAKYKINDKINLLMSIIFGLFGENWNARLKKKRLGKAIRKAERMHLLNNGKRYFVIEGSKNDYMVMDRALIEVNKKRGVFRKDAQIVDFLRESPYYTKSECLSTTKGLKAIPDEKGFFFYFWIWFVIVFGLSVLMVWVFKV